MKASTHEITYEGALLRRGFWLYVWEITAPQNRHLYYVGRTGDSSSINAQSPFNRMGQHLGSNRRSNVLRRRLRVRGIEPESCTFRLVAYGPILKEASSREKHRKSRDNIAAVEKALADAMTAAGYNVINEVNCRIALNAEMFAGVRDAFAKHFSRLEGEKA